MNTNTKTLLACLGCLVLGYFIGREHIKYEMRSVMQDAAKAMQTSLSAAFGGTDQNKAPQKEVAKLPPAEQPLVASLLKKGFSPKDLDNNKFEEDITMTVNFENKTGKNIRAFDGVLVFTDLLDNKILSSRIELNKRIAQGSSLSWDGALEYNQFMSSHQRLRSEPIENLKVSFQTHKVLFEDGTSKDYE